MAESAGRFDQLFASYRSSLIPDLWPWQREVFTAYEGAAGDAAIELPTGAGITLVGLLVGEDFRQREQRPVAYLAGTKQLAQQVERQARQLGVTVVRFQDAKSTWPAASVQAYNFGQAIVTTTRFIAASSTVASAPTQRSVPGPGTLRWPSVPIPCALGDSRGSTLVRPLDAAAQVLADRCRASGRTRPRRCGHRGVPFRPWWMLRTHYGAVSE